MRLSAVDSASADLHAAEIRSRRNELRDRSARQGDCQEGLSVYRVDGEMLRDLQPDVIVTQSHCEVCAVSLRDVESAVCAWLRSCPQLVSLTPNGLADVWTSIEQIAAALQVS